MPETRVFLDTSALFAAVLSSGGGARALLKLGESGAVRIWVGPTVLQEADEVFRRKAPDLLPLLAALLHQTGAQVGPQPPVRVRPVPTRWWTMRPMPASWPRRSPARQTIW